MSISYFFNKYAWSPYACKDLGWVQWEGQIVPARPVHKGKIGRDRRDIYDCFGVQMEIWAGLKH